MSTATPVRELFTNYRRQIAIAFGVTCLNAVGFYLILSYMPTYLITELGMGRTSPSSPPASRSSPTSASSS